MLTAPKTSGAMPSGASKSGFHWQNAEQTDDRDSAWIPVLQRQADPGYGWQILPRIGQEVLVDFIGGNLRQPLVLGSLYNSRGEAGVVATPALNAQAP
jgi:type VI secretion system secreted protein VgrG